MRQRRHLLDADLVADLRRNRVERFSQRIGQRHRAHVFAAIVARPPVLDRHRHVKAHGARRQAVFERRGIDEHLERGARLAARLRGAVELRLQIVTPTDHGADRARLVVDHECRAFGRPAVLSHGVEALLDRLLRGGLQLEIERQLDHHVWRGIGENVVHTLDRVIEGVTREAVRLIGREHQRLRFRFVGLRLGDEARFDHLLEHIGLPFFRTRRLRLLGKARGRLREGREHCRLGERQVFRRLAEIGVRSSVEAIGAGAEIDAVEIELEDLVLRQHPLEVVGEASLLRFPLQRLVRRQEQILDQLLRDRGCALDRAAGANVGEHRADNGPYVDAGVLAEALVLGADEGVHDMLRNIGEAHGAAIARPTHGDRCAVRVNELDGRLAVERPERLLVRQHGHLREHRVPQHRKRDDASGDRGANHAKSGPTPSPQQAVRTLLRQFHRHVAFASPSVAGSGIIPAAIRCGVGPTPPPLQ